MKFRVALPFLFCMPFLCPALAGEGQSASESELQERAARIVATMEKIHQDFLSGNEKPGHYVMSELDLNAFLEVEIRKNPATGVEQLRVQLHPENNFTTRLVVDLDEVQVELNSVFEALFQNLIGGRQSLEVEGLLRTENGQGSYEVIRASLNEITVPAVVVESVLRAVGSRLDPPFDPTEPFELEQGIREIEISRGTARILTGRP